MRAPIGERLVRVQEAVVASYIRTGQPVGSRYVWSSSRIGLSPASIRSIMAHLEELGLLEKPHTSAGRVPTEQGYRLYVDRLMKRTPVKRTDARSIRNAMTGTRTLEGLLDQVCRSLESLTRQAGVAVVPPAVSGMITTIKTSLAGTRGLMITVDVEPGGGRTATISLSSLKEQEGASKLLGRIAEDLVGKDTLEAARMLRGRYENGTGGGLAAALGGQLAELLDCGGLAVHVAGKANLVSAMEDTRQAGSLLEVLESKDSLSRLLMPDDDETGTSVRIGSENVYPPMRSCSIIRSTYTIGDSKGAVGVIGPLRMEYPRLMALVEYASSELTRILAD